MQHANRPSCGSWRRAYALAITMIVLVVVGILTAVMLDRQSQTTLAVSRQLDQYQEHHGKKGLAEVVEAYLLMLQNVSMAGLIEEDPHLFDLELADRSIVSVRFEHAQGRALAYPNKLDTRVRDKAERVLMHLRELVGPERLDRLTRVDGPMAIDAQSADEAVIRAAARAATQDMELGDRLADELLRARADHELTRADVGRIATRLELSTEQRRDATELFTVLPAIWGVRVELRTPRFGNEPERLVSAYEGLVQIGTSRARRTGRGNVFLSFEPIDLAEQATGATSDRGLRRREGE